MLSETIVNEDFIREMNKYKEKPKGKGLLESCNDNVILYAEYMLGVKLRAWQVYVLVHMQKIISGELHYREGVILTSRQIGKTTLDAIFANWVLTFNKKCGGLHQNSPVGIISASDDQAKKLLKEMKRLLILGDKYMEKNYLDNDGKPLFGKQFLQNLIDKKGENNTDTISFEKYNDKKHGEFLLRDSIIGSTAKSLPPTSAILGNTFAVAIVDEAGKTDKIPDAVFLDFLSFTVDEYSAPIFYTSTAWEPHGIFYEKCDLEGVANDPDVWKCLFTIDAIRLEAPGRYAKVLKKIEQMNKEGKIDEVQRGYYCRFVKGEKSYFDLNAINKSFTEDYRMLDSFKGECDMGIDFGGQVTSRTVVTITCKDEKSGLIRRLFYKRYDVGRDLTLLEDVEALLLKFNVQRIIPDDCPAGDFLIRKMIEKGWNVTPMNFRTDKVKKYGAFRSELNKGNILSFIDDDLKIEMRAMEKSEGSKQSVIQHAPGYTDDMIDSFVLSCYHFVSDDLKPSFHYWGMEDEDE